MTRHTYTIGAVGFGFRFPQPDGVQPCPLLGAIRKRLLQAVLDGRPLPAGWILMGQRAGGPWVEITPDDVNWTTSGLKATP